jgi:hypothetical protein
MGTSKRLTQQMPTMLDWAGDDIFPYPLPRDLPPLDAVSRYSATRSAPAALVVKLVEAALPSPSPGQGRGSGKHVVWDAFGGAGADAIAMMVSGLFGQVNVSEIHADRARSAHRRLSAYHAKSASLSHHAKSAFSSSSSRTPPTGFTVRIEDSLTVLTQRASHADVVYMDPPWGGPGYRKRHDVLIQLAAPQPPPPKEEAQAQAQARDTQPQPFDEAAPSPLEAQPSPLEAQPSPLEAQPSPLEAQARSRDPQPLEAQARSRDPQPLEAQARSRDPQPLEAQARSRDPQARSRDRPFGFWVQRALAHTRVVIAKLPFNYAYAQDPSVVLGAAAIVHVVRAGRDVPVFVVVVHARVDPTERAALQKRVARLHGLQNGEYTLRTKLF